VTHFDLEVTRTLLRRADEMTVFSMVRGSEPQLVGDELTSALSLRQEPEVLLTPTWWPWMPLIPFNITIETK
jgi:hypothetical protein